MMKLLARTVATWFLISFSLIMLVRVGRAESVPCPKGQWHDTYTQLVETAQGSIIQQTDTSEEVLQKTMTLYSIQFQLEAFAHTESVPDCAHDLVNKTVQLLRFQADFQLFLILQSGDWAVPDETAESIVSFYTIMLERAVSSLGSAVERTELISGDIQ